MKKIILTIITVLFFSLSAFSNQLAQCYKLYPKSADSLFLSALSALSSSKDCTISEIQSKNGYILFIVGSTYYLLTVTKRYQNQTEIRILPQNSNFQKGSEVIKNIFALIDEEIKTPLEPVK